MTDKKKRSTYKSNAGFDVDTEFGKRAKAIEDIFNSFEKDIKETKQKLKKSKKVLGELNEEYTAQLKKLEEKMKKLREELFFLNHDLWFELIEPMNLEITLSEL